MKIFKSSKVKFLAHSLNKEEVYQVLERVDEQLLAIEYMGQIPKDLGFIL